MQNESPEREVLDLFYSGVDDMEPEKIEIKCPHCHFAVGNVSSSMGDRTIKCQNCGRYIHYSFRRNEVKITHRPERSTSSGLTFC